MTQIRCVKCFIIISSSSSSIIVEVAQLGRDATITMSITLLYSALHTIIIIIIIIIIIVSSSLGCDCHLHDCRLIAYVEASAWQSGAAADAATRKEAKYSNLPSQYTFYPIAIETHGPLNETALDILCELGRRITACSGDDRGGFFLSQRLSIWVQRFNAVLLHDGFSMD